jgi:hypothetical protein
MVFWTFEGQGNEALDPSGLDAAPRAGSGPLSKMGNNIADAPVPRSGPAQAALVFLLDTVPLNTGQSPVLQKGGTPHNGDNVGWRQTR